MMFGEFLPIMEVLLYRVSKPNFLLRFQNSNGGERHIRTRCGSPTTLLCPDPEQVNFFCSSYLSRREAVPPRVLTKTSQ